MSSNIKQQLRQYVDSADNDGRSGRLETALCRDALAEIERLEESHGKTVAAARQVEALERIADTLERVEKRMQTRWNLL